MKYIICILTCMICFNKSNGQTNYQELEIKLKEIIDTTWIFKIDNSDSAYFLSGLIKSGNYAGTIKFNKKTFPKNFMKMVVFETSNDSIIFLEIDKYQSYASCGLGLDNSLSEAKIKIGQLILFLPMYPCWTSGYNDDSKVLIRKLIEKTK